MLSGGLFVRISWFWSKAFLSSRWALWSLFITNLIGTIYGYIWYGNQLVDTVQSRPLWQVPFVPDSPTASLFFTLSLVYLLLEAYRGPFKADLIRKGIEVLAVITSVKYGVWAVAMIAAGAAQGDALHWQDWMLVCSHLGMAIEALLFTRFYSYGWKSILVASVWTLWNDYMDYEKLLYPWLPGVLEDDLTIIARFTVGLSIASIGISIVTMKLFSRRQV